MSNHVDCHDSLPGSLPDNSAAANRFRQTHPAGNPMITYVCLLKPGCTLPLEGTTTSVYRHLRQHGLIHKHRDRASCPWPGCPKEMFWGNIARHIVESHLGVKLHCMFCGKEYTRSENLHVHKKACIAKTTRVSDPDNCYPIFSK
ncbi:hypothetical protein EDC04DRAFT_2190120 [Pisolithus marmoratus]|nr:hypothetical protein EDC04DRAFT_2190120 [Pisolithus marmoratus]